MDYSGCGYDLSLIKLVSKARRQVALTELDISSENIVS